DRFRAEALLRLAAPERDRRPGAAAGQGARSERAGAPGAPDGAAALDSAAAQHEPEPAFPAEPARLPERLRTAGRAARTTRTAAPPHPALRLGHGPRVGRRHRPDGARAGARLRDGAPDAAPPPARPARAGLEPQVFLNAHETGSTHRGGRAAELASRGAEHAD